MMQNLSQLISVLRGRNPQEMVMSLIQSQKINDPQINQLIQYAQTGDMNNLVNLASSMCQAKGIDFNSEYQNFMSMLK